MSDKCDWLLQRWERTVGGWIPCRTLTDLSEEEAMTELHNLRESKGAKYRIFREVEELDPPITSSCQLEVKVYHTDEDVSDLEEFGINVVPSRFILKSEYEEPDRIIRTLIVVMNSIAQQELQKHPKEAFYEFATAPYRFLCEMDLFLSNGGTPDEFMRKVNGNRG